MFRRLFMLGLEDFLPHNFSKNSIIICVFIQQIFCLDFCKYFFCFHTINTKLMKINVVTFINHATFCHAPCPITHENIAIIIVLISIRQIVNIVIQQQ